MPILFSNMFGGGSSVSSGLTVPSVYGSWVSTIDFNHYLDYGQNSTYYVNWLQVPDPIGMNSGVLLTSGAFVPNTAGTYRITQTARLNINNPVGFEQFVSFVQRIDDVPVGRSFMTGGVVELSGLYSFSAATTGFLNSLEFSSYYSDSYIAGRIQITTSIYSMF